MLDEVKEECEGGIQGEEKACKKVVDKGKAC